MIVISVTDWFQNKFPNYQNQSWYVFDKESYFIHGLVQDGRNSNVLAMELLQSCAKLSIWIIC